MLLLGAMDSHSVQAGVLLIATVRADFQPQHGDHVTLTTLPSCMTTCPEKAQHWPGPATGWRICEGEELTCQTGNPNTIRSCALPCTAMGWVVVKGVFTIVRARDRLAQSDQT